MIVKKETCEITFNSSWKEEVEEGESRMHVKLEITQFEKRRWKEETNAVSCSWSWKVGELFMWN